VLQGVPKQASQLEPEPLQQDAVMIAAEELQNELLLAAEEALQEDGFDGLSEEEIKSALAEVAQGLISG
jgi:AcrR family transcriptional regulator